MKLNNLTLGLALVGLSTSAIASTIADARSAAMGGTGVASSSHLNASFTNPALAAAYNATDDFGLILPSVGVRINDKEEMYDKIDEIQNLTDLLEAGFYTPQDLDDWKALLRSMDKKIAFGEAQIGLSISIPNKYVATNFFAAANMIAIGTAHVDENDFLITDPTTENPNSRAQVALAGTTDVGFTFAKEFKPLGQKVKIGISPKYQTLMALTYQSNIESFDDTDYDFEKDHTEKGGFNIDFGLSYAINNRTTFGTTVKNVISRELVSNDSMGDSVTYMVEPEITTGLAYTNSWFTAALDVDLTKYKPFKEFDYEQQFSKFGVEFDAWGWAQLRGGYIHSMTNYNDDMITAGIGLKPFGLFGIDVSGQYNKDNQYSVNTQLIVNF